MGVRPLRSSSMAAAVKVTGSRHSRLERVQGGLATSSFDSGEVSGFSQESDVSGIFAAYSSISELSGYNDGISSHGVDAISQGDTSLASSNAREISASGHVRSGDLSGRFVPLGRFQIVGTLGEGRSATVYRAYDPVLERDVALKVPRPGDVKTAKWLERFLGEARALARLRHPRIVPVYDAGRAGESHFIAMALIEGQSLADRMRAGPLGYQRVAEVVAELADALSYAHEQGVVHRDVKPANIHLDARGEIYLMDFGIAYRPDSGEMPVAPGTILGTPAYVAPEQAQGGQTDVLPASDQYSLGAVLYELLCGHPPFSGPPSYVLFHVIHHDPPLIRGVAPKVPAELAAICMKALAKRPAERYAGCRELAEDLRRWLRGESPTVYRRPRTRLGR